MRNRFDRGTDAGKTANPVPLVMALALGLTGLVCAKDCENSKDRVRVREGVSVLEGENRNLTREIRNVIQSGPVHITQTCKMAYEQCMADAKLPKDCDVSRIDEACATEVADAKAIDDLECCYAIQKVENGCRKSFRDCVLDTKTVDL